MLAYPCLFDEQQAHAGQRSVRRVGRRERRLGDHSVTRTSPGRTLCCHDACGQHCLQVGKQDNRVSIISMPHGCRDKVESFLVLMSGAPAKAAWESTVDPGKLAYVWKRRSIYLSSLVEDGASCRLQRG